MAMSIDATAAYDPRRQQKSANITCYKCVQRGHYRKCCPSSAGTSQVLDQTLTTSMYSPPTTVTQTMTVSCAALQSSLVIILKELVKTKQRN